MHPLIYFVFAGLISLLTVGFIEDRIMPRLNDSSKFKKWWRNHVVSENFGQED